jgi:hypothetical protein
VVPYRGGFILIRSGGRDGDGDGFEAFRRLHLQAGRR